MYHIHHPSPYPDFGNPIPGSSLLSSPDLLIHVFSVIFQIYPWSHNYYTSLLWPLLPFPQRSSRLEPVFSLSFPIPQDSPKSQRCPLPLAESSSHIFELKTHSIWGEIYVYIYIEIFMSGEAMKTRTEHTKVIFLNQCNSYCFLNTYPCMHRQVFCSPLIK